ncbi:MAG: hypothetical protein ACXITV_01475 [Luteibaculaceae bacterium]
MKNKLNPIIIPFTASFLIGAFVMYQLVGTSFVAAVSAAFIGTAFGAFLFYRLNSGKPKK